MAIAPIPSKTSADFPSSLSRLIHINSPMMCSLSKGRL